MIWPVVLMALASTSVSLLPAPERMLRSDILPFSQRNATQPTPPDLKDCPTICPLSLISPARLAPPPTSPRAIISLADVHKTACEPDSPTTAPRLLMAYAEPPLS